MRLFHPGRIVSTPGAIEAFREAGELPWTYLIRHLQGDWGNLDAEDWEENEKALKLNLRLFSAYCLRNGRKVWLITEHDRSVTTFLLPSEY